jgi:hypothetical protein
MASHQIAEKPATPLELRKVTFLNRLRPIAAKLKLSIREGVVRGIKKETNIFDVVLEPLEGKTHPLLLLELPKKNQRRELPVQSKGNPLFTALLKEFGLVEYRGGGNGVPSGPSDW